MSSRLTALHLEAQAACRLTLTTGNCHRRVIFNNFCLAFVYLIYLRL